MLVIVMGKPKEGITNVAAKVGTDRAKDLGKKVYSQIALSQIKYLPIVDLVEESNYRLEKLVEENKAVDLVSLYDRGELVNSVLIFNFCYKWMDSRTPQSKFNRILSFLASKSSKVEVDIILTTENLDLIDKRLRRVCDFIVYVAYIPTDQIVKTLVFSRATGKRLKKDFNTEDLRQYCEDSIGIKELDALEEDISKIFGEKFKGMGLLDTSDFPISLEKEI